MEPSRRLGKPRASVPICWVLPGVVQAATLFSEATLIIHQGCGKDPMDPSLIASVTSDKSFYLLDTASFSEKNITKNNSNFLMGS